MVRGTKGKNTAFQNFLGDAVTQWVKYWPATLAVRGLNHAVGRFNY